MFLTETQRSLVVMSLRYAAEHYRETNARAMEEANSPTLRDIFLQQAKDAEFLADKIENSFSVEITESSEVS